MKDSNFLLRTEVTIDDAHKLIKWLNDPMVIKYLNEADNVITYLKWLINNVNLELLTPTLNENGKFYIINSELEQAIGFARLLKKGSGHEIVIVIGERDYWHRSYGTRVIDQLLKIAFLDLRSSYLMAKIHYDNRFSYKAFRKVGFIKVKDETKQQILFLHVKDYLQFMKMQRASDKDILITKADKAKIERIGEFGYNLQKELARAIIVHPQQIKEDVITMNSVFEIKIDDQIKKARLVYPDKAKHEDSVSVLSPLGTAVLGYRRKSFFLWPFAEGKKKILINEIFYQPEANGNYQL